MNRAPRSAVLVTIDCLRADHVGHLGYSRATTPFLDCLADEGVVFSNAMAAGAPTYFSLPALLASRFPLRLGRDLIGIAPGETTLASTLQECGLATAAFSAANPYVSAQFGYDQGFEVFSDFLDSDFGNQPPSAPSPGLRTRTNNLISAVCHALPALGAAYDEIYFEYCQRQSPAENASFDTLRKFPAADVIVDRALAWLNENSSRPFFLWLHLMDPHAPYFPSAEALDLMQDGHITPGDARYANSFWARNDVALGRLAEKRDLITRLYDAGIRWADSQIRRLAEKLVELNVWDQCALAVTADHGEQFLEHGGRFHSPLRLTEELIHVPLLVRVPGCSKTEVEQPTSLLDLAPTLLEILDMPAPADFRGRSWWTKAGRTTGARPVIAEAVHGCTNPLHRSDRAGNRLLVVRQGSFKLAVDFSSGNEDLFNLQIDPLEQNPLARGDSYSLRKQLLQHAGKHLAESHKSRDFDRRNAALLRDLRIEWAHPAANARN